MSDGTSNNNPIKNNGEVAENNLSLKGNLVPSPSTLPYNIMYRGYFPLWRKIVDWGWYQDSNTKAVFIHLLLLCNHQENYFKGHKLLPGQCIVGRKKLSLDLGLSERQIRTALKHLKTTNEVSIKATTKFSIVTLNNYEKHLPKEYNFLGKTTNKRPTNDQRPTTPNNDKNVKNDSSTKSPVLSDEAFLQSLKDNVAYGHIDLKIEFGKMDAWLSTRPRRRKTRRFMVNWLNKVEKPMEGESGLRFI